MSEQHRPETNKEIIERDLKTLEDINDAADASAKEKDREKIGLVRKAEKELEHLGKRPKIEDEEPKAIVEPVTESNNEQEKEKPENYYKILGIEEDATEDEIKHIFKKNYFDWQDGQIKTDEYEKKNEAILALLDKFKSQEDSEPKKESLDSANEEVTETKLKARKEKTEPQATEGAEALVLDPNFKELQKDLTKEAVEGKMTRIIEKATAIFNELQSKGTNGDVALLTKHLDVKDRAKLAKEGLTEKRVQYLKDQCRVIIQMAQERFETLKETDPNNQEALESLAKKIKKGEVEEIIKTEKKKEKEELKKEYFSLMDECMLFCESSIEEFKGKNDKAQDYFANTLYELKLLLPDIREKINSATVVELKGYIKNRQRKLDEFKIKAEKFKINQEEKPKEKKEKTSQFETAQEHRKRNADEVREYRESGFWGKIKIELRDIFGIKKRSIESKKEKIEPK